MPDLHAIREQLREARSVRAAAPADNGGKVSPVFWIVAVFAAITAFAIVLFTPRIYSVQRTASLPSFQETRDRLDAEARGELVRAPVIPSSPSRYAGKSADEAGKLADEVCFQRAHAEHPHWSKTPRLTTRDASDFADVKGIKHFDTLLHCLVTEAPARYCSVRQRTMITAEIAAYFRGIEHANLVVKNFAAGVNAGRSQQERFDLANSEPYQAMMSLSFAHDPKVLTGIEGLIRAGYLTPADRSSFGALAPRPVKDRLANVVANVSPCPKPPWWQSMWKS